MERRRPVRAGGTGIRKSTIIGLTPLAWLADVVLVGARLGKLVELVNEHDLEWVSALDARYSGLVAKTPWIASITIARLDKSGGAAG